jgi:hypothetical protein
LRFPAAGINPVGAASDATRNTTDGRLEFSASATNMIALQVQMPHAWKEGSAISPHIHWSPETTNVGNVLWQLDYKIAGINETFPGSWTTQAVLAPSGGVANKHLLVEFADIPMTGKTLSCMILMLLSRIGGDGTDTFTGLAQLNEFDIHYESDSLGSREEYVK